MHLTYSGVSAGATLCHGNREALTDNGDTFVHYGSLYGITDEQILTDAVLKFCPDCKMALQVYIDNDD